jgi:hypothetical protein
MAGTLTVQNLQGPSSGSNANKVLIPSGHTFVGSTGQVIQMVTNVDQSNGSLYTADNSSSTHDLYSFSYTPKTSNSTTVVMCSVFMGTGIATSSSNADKDNRALYLYKGATLLQGKNQGGQYSAFTAGGFYMTDVAEYNYTPSYYGGYDGRFYNGTFIDSSSRTAGTQVTYTLKGTVNSNAAGVTASLPYNRTYYRAGDGGTSSFIIYEIAG